MAHFNNTSYDISDSESETNMNFKKSNKSTDDYDTLQSNKKMRTTHSEVEKRRREKMNKFLFELTPYLPVEHTNINKKLDKITILKLAAQHMKNLKNSTLNSNDTVNRQSLITNNELETLMFDTNDIEGFLITIKCDTNKIVHVSESCSKYIGYTSKELTDKLFFEIVHHSDLKFVKEQLVYLDMSFNSTSVDSIKSRYIVNKRSFLSRICKGPMMYNAERDKNQTPSYQIVHFNGYFKYEQQQAKASTDQYHNPNDQSSTTSNLSNYYLILYGRLIDFKQQINYEYVSKFDVDGKYIYAEPQVYVVLGYLDRDLLTNALKDFVHMDDFHHIQKAIVEAITSRQKVKTKPYRHFSKHSDFIYVESVFYALFNPFSNKLEYIIANNKRCNFHSSLLPNPTTNIIN